MIAFTLEGQLQKRLNFLSEGNFGGKSIDYVDLEGSGCWEGVGENLPLSKG